MTHTTEEIKKALELVKEYESLPLGDDIAKRIKPDLKGWLQEQLPTLFEKFKAYERGRQMIIYDPKEDHPNDEGFNPKVNFKYFKGHFKEELSGTRGLREVIKKMETMKGEPRGVCILEAKAILERMEGEG